MIQRSIYPHLVDHLAKKEISLITGPRQSGKTTLMLWLKGELDQKGEPTLFLNLDVEWDRPHLESQAALIRKLELELGKKGGFVFVDEIQRKEDAGRFLKGLYDLNLPYKFIVSGSGSLELKERIHESLVGRKRLFELNTLTFEEFFNYKTASRYHENLAAFFEIDKERAHHLLMEYLNFGGYPRVVLEDRQDEKVRVIDDIYRSVLERDVAYLLKVEKTEAFNRLIKVLAGQIGNLINYKELSSTLGTSFQTVKKYLWYAQKIFLLNLVTPYSRNVRKEIAQSPVAYFGDLGLRNYALGIFGTVASPAECGFLFQNLVFLILSSIHHPGLTTLHFWRTKDKAEVDFIVEKGEALIPVEVKFKALNDVEMPRSLLSFCERYQPAEAHVVNLALKKTIKVGKTRVHFIPYWELLGTSF
jgi:predicted AAA+ superfamily ATPase